MCESMFYRITYGVAQPVLKLLSSVAVVRGNGFPVDHQLILKVQNNKLLYTLVEGEVDNYPTP